jgi:hypothetical protein
METLKRKASVCSAGPSGQCYSLTPNEDGSGPAGMRRAYEFTTAESRRVTHSTRGSIS